MDVQEESKLGDGLLHRKDDSSDISTDGFASRQNMISKYQENGETTKEDLQHKNGVENNIQQESYAVSEKDIKEEYSGEPGNASEGYENFASQQNVMSKYEEMGETTKEDIQQEFSAVLEKDIKEECSGELGNASEGYENFASQHMLSKCEEKTETTKEDVQRENEIENNIQQDSSAVSEDYIKKDYSGESGSASEGFDSVTLDCLENRQIGLFRRVIIPELNPALYIVSKKCGISNYKCAACDYTTTFKSHLSQHIMARHTGERPFKCKQCNYSATQRINLLEHRMSKHSEVRPYTCEDCGYGTVRRCSLQRHIRSTHIGERPFKCDSCDYTATRKSHLMEHTMTKHMEEKPFKCDACDYCSARKTELLRHKMAKHGEEKPYKCDTCDYTTTRRTYLSRHVMAKHSGERPYQCEVCDYSATNKTRLSQHVLAVHSGDKPFKCQLCSYSSVKKLSLFHHVKTKHSDENLKKTIEIF